jgi:hypothetical protein
MPWFREVFTGQIVENSDPLYFDGLARWERIEGEPSAPDPEPAPTPQPAAVLPDEDAIKAVWVAYAKAHGYTDADLKGKTKPEVIALFA